VAHLFDNANDSVDYEVPAAPARRRWGTPVVVVCLALLGAGSAIAWHSWGGGWPSWPTLALGTAPPEPEKPVALKDFQALQQQAASAAQSTAQQLAAQQAEIKRLSDQVAALAARIDTLQNTAASAQATTPAPSPPPPPAARKRTAAPKQQPAISVGGAPLPPPAR
jgi:uncharacterized coiled-coil protein SlyX